MNGAGIENGDLIVLEKRETAENREIAVVDIEGNAIPTSLTNNDMPYLSLEKLL